MRYDYEDFDKPCFLNIEIPAAEDPEFRIKFPKKPGPFFNIDSEDSAASSFLRAVCDGSGEAFRFLSKRYGGNVDLSALREVLTASEYTSLIPQGATALSSRRTKALLVVNRERNEKSVIFLHMIREPDQFGQWKIFSVEEE